MAGDDIDEDEGGPGGAGGPTAVIALPGSVMSPHFFIHALLEDLPSSADPPLTGRLSRRLIDAIGSRLLTFLSAAAEANAGAPMRVFFGLLNEGGTLMAPAAFLPPSGDFTLDAAEPAGEEEGMALLSLLVSVVDDVAQARRLDAGLRKRLAEGTAWTAASLFDEESLAIDGIEGGWKIAPILRQMDGPWLVPGDDYALHEYAHGIAASVVAGRLLKEAETWPTKRVLAEAAAWLSTSTNWYPPAAVPEHSEPLALVADADHAAKTAAAVEIWSRHLHYTLTDDFGIDPDLAEAATETARARLAEILRQPIAGLTPVLALVTENGRALVPPGPGGARPERAGERLPPAWRMALAEAFGRALMDSCAAAGLAFGPALLVATIALHSLLQRFDDHRTDARGERHGHAVAARDKAGGLVVPRGKLDFANLAGPAMKRCAGRAK